MTSFMALRWILHESSADANRVNFFQRHTLYKVNLLKWTTATEKNNDYFDVERSQNGIEFTFLRETLREQKI
jgi:hypothetical protein